MKWEVKATGVDGTVLGTVSALTKVYATRKAKAEFGRDVFVRPAK
jgi:hypothetical protein